MFVAHRNNVPSNVYLHADGGAPGDPTVGHGGEGTMMIADAHRGDMTLAPPQDRVETLLCPEIVASPPTVTAATPAVGTEGGDTVTIVGSNLGYPGITPLSIVVDRSGSLGTADCSAATVLSSSMITCTTPAGFGTSVQLTLDIDLDTGIGPFGARGRLQPALNHGGSRCVRPVPGRGRRLCDVVTL